MRSKTGIKQRHRNRIRLFTGRARQAEDAQCATAADFCQALPGQAAQRGKGFGVTEKPGLGHDHRFDQRLLFILGAEQTLPVAIVVGHAQCHAALANGTLDNRRADRSHIQADALLQIIEKTLVKAHGATWAQVSASPSANNSADTAGLSRSSTLNHCNSPASSLRTGPRYGASRLSTP